jgi:transglutaminase-like putative cysteine protease
MEVRMRQRDEGQQQCVQFDLTVNPATRVMSYRDFLGNDVHHFDIPRTHRQEQITAKSIVRILPQREPPPACEPEAWDELDAIAGSTPAAWEMMMPSPFTQPTELLDDVAEEIEAVRRDDPLSTVWHITHAIRDSFQYKPATTTAESPIDEALSSRAGVCQDFAHVMLAMLRRLNMPCRYVSGYLYHRDDYNDSLAPGDATHAWVEVLLPRLGWVGFDPTNKVDAMDNHIRTAIGRDYGDVPPTRGVYRGNAKGKLSVNVKVTRQDEAPMMVSQSFEVTGWSPPEPVQTAVESPKPFEYYAQQMQQQ